MRTEFGRCDKRKSFVFHIVRGGEAIYSFRTVQSDGVLFLKGGELLTYPTYQHDKSMT